MGEGDKIAVDFKRKLNLKAGLEGYYAYIIYIMTFLHSTSFFFLSNENEALKAPDRYYRYFIIYV